jgi:type IX secretion system PorP/SprF family membrane protein
MKKMFIIACSFYLFTIAFGQQVEINSLYHNSISYYNPAYTASQHQLRGGAQYRDQWSEIKGAPVNYFGIFEQNFDSLNSGSGITYTRNEVGFLTFQTALINYRYEVRLSHVNRLLIGVSGGFSNLALDAIWFTPDSLPNHSPLPNSSRETNFIINSGVILKLNRFSIGLSGLQLNRPNYDQLNYRSEIHSVLTLDYKWLITRKFNLKPALFWITDTKYMSLTTLLKANYNNMFWGMGGYRFSDAVVLAAGVLIRKRISLGYNLDVINSKLSNGVNYSHGLYLNYQIQRPIVNSFSTTGTPGF